MSEETSNITSTIKTKDPKCIEARCHLAQISKAAKERKFKAK